jgi:16S rRNA (uracil1498-N3)-methyltransferase
MSDRFYVNCPLGPGPVSLEGAEAHHLAGVCRLRAGDPVCLFNGDGNEYPARVTQAGRRCVTLEVLGVVSPWRELPEAVEVAAPLPKGDRAQFMLEKLTELGVRTFVPLQTRRCVVHPREAKLEKLQRHVIEASKQCGRNVLLQIQPLVEWETYCRSGNLPHLKLLAHPGRESGTAATGQIGQSPERKEPTKGPAAGGVPPPLCWSGPRGEVAFAIGPEGGFTAEEIASGRAGGWQLLDLGPRILRVETAALVLAAWAGLPSAGQAGQERPPFSPP